MYAERAESGLVKSLHSPRALLLGVAFSFLACCVAGEVVSRRNVYHVFQRFHTWINFESHHYPTVRQVRALARERAGSGKVLVIVGGSSVLHGSGQPVGELWTRRLQEQLGDGYRVLNLGMKGALPAEFGGVAAEVLSQEHERVIYVASLGSSGVVVGESEAHVYRPFFWEAYERGLLRPHPAREEKVRALRRRYENDDSFSELRRQMRVDHLTSSRDLWSAVAYKGVSTVWSVHVRRSVLRARKHYPDLDYFSMPEWNLRYPAASDSHDMHVVRSASARPPETFSDPTHWAPDLLAAFPEPDRKRTLILGVCDSPYYVDRLGSAEAARYRAIVPSYLPQVERLGFSVLDVSAGWTADDFIDRVHLNAQGGRRLADLTAPKIRQMAKELGYLNERGEP